MSSELSTPDLQQTAFVVVPAYNEGASIEAVVGELVEVYPNVVVVDDGSRDDTFNLAHRQAPYVLRHAINRGQGAALQTGIEFALRRGARYIVTFDADGQHQVSDIRRLLEPIAHGECDVSLGSRFLGEAIDLPGTRRILLRLGVLFTWLVNGVRLSDVHNGLRAFSRKAAERIHIRLDGMAHASELIDQICNSDLVYREVPVTVRYTEYSKMKGQSSRGAMRIAFHYLLGRVMR